jgi:hypothetical protein
MPTTKPAASFDYTDAELLALWRECLATISVKGGRYRIGQREWQSHDLREVREMVEYYERRVAAESGLAVNHARFVRPS